jgi:hypothetical protein
MLKQFRFTIAGVTTAIMLGLAFAACPATDLAAGGATCERVENGYRLANDRFEAIVSFAGPKTGVTHLSHRGEPKRRDIQVSELTITLRLATDAPRIDILNWNFHAGSGTDLPPENEWGYQLGLYKTPVDNNGGLRSQRLNETLMGPPFYTDIYYPGYAWYRRMIELPKDWKGKPVVFVLGCCDQYDWRSYWVYLNGARIGQSSFDDTYNGPWHEAARYVLKPGEPGYANLKFGEANLLAVQARGLDRRTPEMPRLELERFSGQSLLVDQYVACGEPTEDVSGFQVVDHRSSVTDGVAAVELELKQPQRPLSITARYWLDPNDAVLHKHIVVHNTGDRPITLLEADVLDLQIEKAPIAGGGQGFPCRVGEDWFAGVAHPAGVARHGPKGVRLQVMPGAALDASHNRDYTSKMAVVGVGNGRRAFSDYLAAHCRRKPKFLNMYSLYGLCEIASGLYPPVELTEGLVLKSVDQLRGLQSRGVRFDYYCIDTGWNDPAGDLKTFHPANFPHGEEKTLSEVRGLGMKPLLWMSPAAGPAVFRGGVANRILDPGGASNSGKWGYYCLMGEPWRKTLREAMLHHVHKNGVRGFKLDEVTFYCGRAEHGHLPNKYGVEKEMDAFIDTLDTVRAQCPDVLYMLYWRFMSPWWLLHADTIYERGLLMEGSTPCELPSRLIRQSVTVALDQGHDWNWDTMPLIGQDSLGVWLSNTRWGSWMGAQGWREAWLMDFVRGNMMHQLWGDVSLLDNDDVEFLATISRWTSKNSDLLRHPKRILGSPWRAEPYGYACCDGDRGVIVINNASFAASQVRVPFDTTIGLAPADSTKRYEVRWIYNDGSVKNQKTQVVAAGGLLPVNLGSFEACMAEIGPAPANARTTAESMIPIVAEQNGPQRIPARFVQMDYKALSWHNSNDAKHLAKVVNGRTRSTFTPEVLAAGPDLSDERDRDAVQENLRGVVSLSATKLPSKLIVVTQFERDGIAWHHLAPFEIVRIAARNGDKILNAKVTPRRMHEEAGAWSWVVYEFDVPPGCEQVNLDVDACHPKTVALKFNVWHSDK